MDLQILVLVSALFIQGLHAAAVEVPSGTINGTPLESLSNLTPEDAKVLAELERLRTSGEQFQNEAMNFVQSLPNRLSEGFTQSHQLFKLLAQMFSSAVNQQIVPLVENLEAGRKRITENASRLAAEGLRRGQETLNAGVSYGRNALDELRKNGNAVIQNGMSYVTSSTPQIQARSLSEELPVKSPRPLTAALPLSGKPEELEENSEEFENYEDDEEHEEGSPELPKLQKLMTRDDQSVTTVLSDQLNQVGTASTDALKNVAQFGSGTIRGLLDALSAVLATTGEVGSHARKAISGIHKSGARTLNTAIDTGGNLVSGGLEKTGSIIESMRVGGAGGGGDAAGPKATE